MKKSTAVWLAVGVGLFTLCWFFPTASSRLLMWYGVFWLSGEVLALAKELD